MNTSDIPEYHRLRALVRAAVSDPDVRADIIVAAIEYATARAINAIDRIGSKPEKDND